MHSRRLKPCSFIGYPLCAIFIRGSHNTINDRNSTESASNVTSRTSHIVKFNDAITIYTIILVQNTHREKLPKPSPKQLHATHICLSELSAEFLGLPLLRVESVLGVLQLLDNFLGPFHLLGESVVFFGELLVLPAELHHQMAQLLALSAAEKLQLLHLAEGHLHTLHQAFQFLLRHSCWSVR